jgi:hypothetical protein
MQERENKQRVLSRAREAYFPTAYISIPSCVILLSIILVLFISCFCKECTVLESTDPFHDCRNLLNMVSKIRHCRQVCSLCLTDVLHVLSGNVYLQPAFVTTSSHLAPVVHQLLTSNILRSPCAYVIFYKRVTYIKISYFSNTYYNSSRDSVVVIATGYGLDDRGVGVRVPVESRIFSSPRRPDRLWGSPNWGLFPWR